MTKSAGPTNLRKSASLLSANNERQALAAFMSAADRFDAKHTKNATAARNQLRKEGIATASGKLTKRYGG